MKTICSVCRNEIPPTVSRYKDANGRIACIECCKGLRAGNDKGVPARVPDSVRGEEP